MGSLKSKLQSRMYSEDTHEILNYFTLQIKDKEIAKEYETYRTNRFNKLFWPQVIVYAWYNINGWIQYLTGAETISFAVRPSHLLLCVIIQALPRYFCNKYSTLTVVPSSAIPLILVQLAFRGYLPGQDTPDRLSEYEVFFLNAVVVSFVINSMTFLQTLVLMPLLHVGFYYY